MDAEIDMKGSKSSIWEGCSAFFLTNSALSFFHARKNKSVSMEHALQDDSFTKELQRRKEFYEDEKEAVELSFKILLRNSQREFSRKMAVKKIANDLAEADLRMFFTDWPLQISVEALLEKQKSQLNAQKMCFVIGKAYPGDAKDAFSRSYSDIVQRVSLLLKRMGLIDNTIYSFKDKPTVVGGPALANIYAMMSSIPTVVMMPSIDNKKKKLTLSIGCWTPDSLFPFQKTIFSMDYQYQRITNDPKYLDACINKFACACATIGAVLNDTYNLTAGEQRCLFPEFAKKTALNQKFSEITAIAIAEYRSFIDSRNVFYEESGEESSAIKELYNDSERKNVERIIIESINKIQE